MSTIQLEQTKTDLILDFVIDFGGPPVAWRGSIMQLVAISDDINTAFMQTPGLLSWWGVLLARLAAELDDAEAKEAKIEAELWEVYRMRCAEEKLPATLTEKAIRSKRSMDNRYVEAQVRVRMIRYYVKIVDAIVRALDGQKEMLINLGAHVRRGFERSQDFHTTTSGAASDIRRRMQQMLREGD